MVQLPRPVQALLNLFLSVLMVACGGGGSGDGGTSPLSSDVSTSNSGNASGAGSTGDDRFVNFNTADPDGTNVYDAGMKVFHIRASDNALLDASGAVLFGAFVKQGRLTINGIDIGPIVVTRPRDFTKDVRMFACASGDFATIKLIGTTYSVNCPGSSGSGTVMPSSPSGSNSGATSGAGSSI